MINVGNVRAARLLPNNWITTRGGKRDKSLYLTFDDGPDPNYTLAICDLLDKHDAKATFFCVGRNLDRYPEIGTELVRRGHLLGNHSHTHYAFSKLSLDNQIAEIEQCQARIRQIDGNCARLFRAPQGRLDLRLLRRLKKLKWHIVHWSYDSRDYEKGSVELQMNVFRDRPVVQGDILLFHDDNKLSLELLERLLPEWKSSGYQIKTVAGLVS